MAESKPAKKDEKAAKIRRKPERESVLSPIFAVSRENAAVAEGAKLEERDEKSLTRSFNFSKVPAHSQVQLSPQPDQGQDLEEDNLIDEQEKSQAARNFTAPAFGWGNTYRPTHTGEPSWGRRTGAPPGMVQRAVDSAFGRFNDDAYHSLKNPDGKEIGVEIALSFEPNEKVDTKLFGLLQALKPTNEGKPNPVDITAKKRMVKEGVGAGWYIDQAKHNRNPMYAVEGAADTATELNEGPTPAPVEALKAPEIAAEEAGGVFGRTHKGWGGHGFRFKEGATWKVKNAELHDTPTRPARGKNAGQVFETAALAIEGGQKGTYYGSVEWGWKTDNAGVFEKLPLRLTSTGVPSGEFMAAAEKWNVAKTSKNKSTIPIPIVKAMKLYSNPIDILLGEGPYVSVPKGSKVQLLGDEDIITARVVVTEGPYAGQEGYVNTLENPIRSE